MSRRKKKKCVNMGLMRQLGEEVPSHVRLHLSEKEIPKLLEMKPPDRPDDKPLFTGFWYDFGGEWACWCSGHSFRNGRYFYEVEVDQSKIISIDTEDKFHAFHDEYKVKNRIFQWMEDVADRIKAQNPASEEEASYVENIGILTRDEDSLFNTCQIDWPKVAQNCGGVEISAHVPWMDRMKHKWFYTWDCRSGVVWDVTALKIKLYARWDDVAKAYIKEG